MPDFQLLSHINSTQIKKHERSGPLLGRVVTFIPARTPIFLMKPYQPGTCCIL